MAKSERSSPASSERRERNSNNNAVIIAVTVLGVVLVIAGVIGAYFYFSYKAEQEMLGGMNNFMGQMHDAHNKALERMHGNKSKVESEESKKPEVKPVDMKKKQVKAPKVVEKSESTTEPSSESSEEQSSEESTSEESSSAQHEGEVEEFNMNMQAGDKDNGFGFGFNIQAAAAADGKNKKKKTKKPVEKKKEKKVEKKKEETPQVGTFGFHVGEDGFRMNFGAGNKKPAVEEPKPVIVQEAPKKRKEKPLPKWEDAPLIVRIVASVLFAMVALFFVYIFYTIIKDHMEFDRRSERMWNDHNGFHRQTRTSSFRTHSNFDF